MAKNVIRTSKKIATIASKVLRSTKSSRVEKSLGGSGLVNRKKVMKK